MPTRETRIADDVLANSITILETLNQVSSAAGVVPLVGAIIATCVTVLQTIEKVKSIRDRADRLAKRITGLAEHIEHTIRSDTDAADASLETNLLMLLQTLERINRDITKLRTKKGFKLFLQQASLNDQLDDIVDNLDTAWRSFDTCCLIRLQQKMNHQAQDQQRQAIYDDRQYRLFRPSDIRLREVSKPWNVSGIAYGEEWSGEWEGRAVAVRIIRGELSSDVSTALICRSSPRTYHPYVAQILGYSHPDIPERFYVLESGSVPLAQCYAIADVRTRLIVWLQMMLDHQTARRDVLQLPPQTSYHDCDEQMCLQTASLNANGRLLLAMEDLVGGSSACMWTSWVDHFDPHLQNDRDIYYVPYDDKVVEEMMSSLTYERHSNMIFDWSSLGSFGILDNHPAVGDYGFITAFDEFVRLGNIMDLVLGDRRLSEGLVKIQHRIFPDEESEMTDGIPRILHIELDDTPMHGMYYTHVLGSVSLKDWCMLAWWDQMDSIAREHRLPIHELVVINEHQLFASLYTLPDIMTPTCPEDTIGLVADRITSPENVSTPASQLPAVFEEPSLCMGCMDVYFHRTLSDEDLGRGPADLWGYFSDDPEPIPEPSPNFEVPGFLTECSSRAKWHRLTALEAELYLCLKRQTKSRRSKSTGS
ncbi:hypothetical protein CERSUDRAFT_119693 [Gelatoporia subvermispora B]|uniref:Mixed lineage kinase domain-containing protein n=1 Tax=Ceriporiopsis subvermispora (strain B) TaxID=914234 RepID=M2P814_CERS8|nr:hypothetical protein CERSUDRAFT_119693 [Gelatoporia subvermispora B]